MVVGSGVALIATSICVAHPLSIAVSSKSVQGKKRVMEKTLQLGIG
ncbi:hypothetical protein C4J97_0313 [Pseudomonas orientalis]|nr:hypothetical protein C4J97_0313 [Pseudomonas orientalis]